MEPVVMVVLTGTKDHLTPQTKGKGGGSQQAPPPSPPGSGVSGG